MATAHGSSSYQFEDAESKPKLDILVSPDDVVWADSCLTNDPDLPKLNLDSLKEALLDFLTLSSEPLETSKSKIQGSKSPSNEETDIMATADGSSSSHQFEDSESKPELDILVSPDDVVWADSCLTNDPDLPKPNLDSLKGAQLTFSSEPLETSKSKIQGSKSPSSEETDTSMSFDVDVDDVTFTETSENKENIVEPVSTSYLANPFLPTYKDEMIEIQHSSDSGVDLGFPEFKTESSFEDIFKVWDLGLPVEEDLLTKQLKKALADSSLKKASSTFDDSLASEGFEDECFEDDVIDDLVAGIADMSL